MTTAPVFDIGTRALRTPQPPGGVLVAERQPAADDNDQVTAQTIEQMGRYVRESLDDPYILRAAQTARQFGSLNAACAQMPADQMDIWGVYWYVKHLVQFRLDEGALLDWQGETDQQDFLISPRVLIRMRQPREDCDGFSMLLATLLTVHGIPALFATVAADPSEPSRWSHVFALAKAGNRWIPLDASHGKYPGWMVPGAHIFKFQAWTLDGKPTNEVKLGHRGLNGYVNLGFRGLGQAAVCSDGSTPDPLSGLCADGSQPTAVGLTTPQLSTLPVNTGYNPPPVTTTAATTTTSPGWTCPSGQSIGPDGTCQTTAFTPASIASLISSAGTAAANALKIANTPAGYTYNAAGQLVPVGSAQFNSILPILLIVVGVLVLGEMAHK